MSAILAGLHFVVYDMAVPDPPPPTIELPARAPGFVYFPDPPKPDDVQFVKRTFRLKKIWNWAGFATQMYEEDGACTIEWPSGKYVACSCPTCALGWTKPGEIIRTP